MEMVNAVIEYFVKISGELLQRQIQ